MVAAYLVLCGHIKGLKNKRKRCVEAAYSGYRSFQLQESQWIFWLELYIMYSKKGNQKKSTISEALFNNLCSTPMICNKSNKLINLLKHLFVNESRTFYYLRTIHILIHMRLIEMFFVEKGTLTANKFIFYFKRILYIVSNKGFSVQVYNNCLLAIWQFQ